MNRTRLPLCILLISFLSACAAPPATTRAPERSQLEQLLAAADSAPAIQAAELRFKAAQLLFSEGKDTEARTLLDRIDTRLLPPALAFDIARLKATQALELKESRRALSYLDRAILPPSLPAPQQAELGELRAQAYTQQQQPIAAARELIASAQLQSDAALRQQIHNQIWQILQQVPDDEIEKATHTAGNNYYEQGWFELAAQMRGGLDISTGGSALAQWRTLWESHPAYSQPPESIVSKSLPPLDVRRVGLLLPLSGNLAEPARAISEGFFAALMAGGSHNQRPEVISIDSSVVSTPGQLATLISREQLDLVIGPLSRDYVAQISQAGPLPAPVLALNQADNTSPGIYHLDLASEQEAILVAQRAWQEGHRRVAVVVPDAPWGQRLADSFTQAFNTLGGSVATQLNYRASEDLSDQIGHLLLTDRSKARASEVRRVIGERFEFDEHPRSDIEAILMTALPQDARQIKPMLAFHFAGDLPVYATSHLYEGSPDPIRDVDLNGVRFLDLPWTLEPASQAHQVLRASRTDVDSRFGRLYALGVDAFNLYPYLPELSNNPGAYIEGETGKLMLSPQLRVDRALPWAVFNNGVPELLPSEDVPIPTLTDAPPTPAAPQSP
ncbi:penicillin-binding protein activator [Marinobacterium sp. D7]|uniref:penicillin-binding protein activator n=1 Tax=Marinobacterium ramblicola TaxID=2849041 RepID=UPI001C2DBE54|nr:penicillin-binding protein activator [Marinobacterium ramblicola]MBV1787075.1 penicillin-binding protein activator [Marinobacterium ramblicola]